MTRTRLSTTVDAELLEGVRRVHSGATDAGLIDEALGAFLARHRATEVDASYAAYDKHRSTSRTSGATSRRFDEAQPPRERATGSWRAVVVVTVDCQG